MALTEKTAAILAMKRAGVTSEMDQNVFIPDIIALEPLACELLAKRVAASSGYEGMQMDYAATPVAGVVDLTALTNILFDIHKSSVRSSSSSIPLMPVDSFLTLVNGGLPVDQLYYYQDGSELRIRDTSGSIVAYATALKIKSNFVPVIASGTYILASQYEGALVDTLAELIIKKLPQLMPMETNELARTGRA